MRSPTSTVRRPWRRCIAVGALAALAAAACGGDDDDAEVASTTRPATTQAASGGTNAPPEHAVGTTVPTTTTTSTTSATTTTTTTTTAATTTTTATTTTLTVDAPTTTLVVEAPGTPIAPPVDAYAHEPVIEVGSIAIPKLGVDMTMYEGIRLTTLDYGPGHWPGTAMPGQDGNVVVAGHRTSSHRVFRHVDQLAAGDEIVFHDDNGTHVYAVDRVEIVEPTAVWIVEPTETATATLFACHPPGSTAQRIVVFADHVSTRT